MCKSFRSARRGLSTMIGATILLTTVVMGLGVISWQADQYQQYQRYSEAAKASDAGRRGESLQIRFPGMLVANQNNTYLFLLDNNGGVPVDIVRMYIRIRWENPPNQALSGTLLIINKFSTAYTNNYLTNGVVNPGEGNHTVRVLTSTLLGFAATDPPKYTVIFVTGRGNTFTGVLPFPITPAPQANLGNFITAGIIRIDFTSYNYSFCTSIQCTGGFSGPVSAMQMSTSDTNLVITILVQNVGTQDVKLDSQSYLLMLGPTATAQSPSYYILDPSSTPTNPVAYNDANPILLDSNPSNTAVGGAWHKLAFGATSPGTTSLRAAPNAQGYAVFLILHGRTQVGGCAGSGCPVYAQTIPSEATQVS